MNSDLNRLQPYPFERLARLKGGVVPPAGLKPIALSIGEPGHPTPRLIGDALCGALDGLARYPVTRGGQSLREAISGWIGRRYGATIDPESQVLPVNGTREALFAIAQTLVDRSAARPVVAMPNPFYQIYEGAALLAGATPCYLDCHAASGYQPDYRSVPESLWRDCQLLYLCSPGNPTGAVTGRETLAMLLEMADRHDFVLVADECYSEIYPDESAPPVGLLEVAASLGRTDYRRCLVFNSLSKRSNAPGLRSGFVAGDAALISAFHHYRTYQGCAMSPLVQEASIAAWQDEVHVVDNRRLYREKFAAVSDLLGDVIEVEMPDAGFYLWLATPGSDSEFALELYRHCNITVLPGSYLSRQVEGAGSDPGAGRVRMALVAPLADCIEAATRIRDYLLGVDGD